jgi:hypothetical protein
VKTQENTALGLATKTVGLETDSVYDVGMHKEEDTAHHRLTSATYPWRWTIGLNLIDNASGVSVPFGRSGSDCQVQN